MLLTIILGSCVSVQGAYVRTLANGLVMVRVGSRDYVGQPIAQAAA